MLSCTLSWTLCIWENVSLLFLRIGRGRSLGFLYFQSTTKSSSFGTFYRCLTALSTLINFLQLPKAIYPIGSSQPIMGKSKPNIWFLYIYTHLNYFITNESITSLKKNLSKQCQVPRTWIGTDHLRIGTCT